MDPSEEVIHKIASCCGEIHSCFNDEKKMKALPTETQAFLYLNKVLAEKFLEQIKEDPNAPSLEEVFEALLIHCAALQSTVDQQMEKRWFARWRKS